MAIPDSFDPPERVLMGPGPSNAAPEVLRAMGRPLVGHLDPAFIGMMEEIKSMLRQVFQTKNQMTFPVSGTGSAGMEFCFVNLLEPGDEVLICINGVFGMRMADVAERCGANVTRVESPWGQIIEPAQVQDALALMSKPKLVAVVHAETSTGVENPVAEISKVVAPSGAMYLVDTVTSLGGTPVKIDEWGVDAVYSGTQKCLSCPPGLSPVSLSERALKAAQSRGARVQSWYLDVNLLSGYWGEARVYHHTAPISMNYALHAALRLVLTEGLENRWRRHQNNHALLKSGLEAVGLSLASQAGYQLPQLNAISVPAKVDEAAVRVKLLNDFNIEVGAGLGPLKGKIWRVGLMGETSSRENVRLLLSALCQCLNESGMTIDANAALSATA
ncbi:MAG: alanine-glyoxylate transaminase/serine-glyoxylate transaminase/serine-pyruvate transaminase [Limisphaerales bacterium]|jgi:alanine-glyoxylate transaminase/serine-glyoxylate transaminase/serine-pyruvate transaminase